MFNEMESVYASKCIFLLISTTYSYRVQCPDISQKLLRASAVCTSSYDYTCLYDTNRDRFSEECNRTHDYVTQGEKYVITGNLRNVDCSSDRYQPFPLWSNVSAVCIYQKTWCEGEGQVIHNNGSLIYGSTCRCDFTKGYKFIQQPRKKCYCIPSEEDCSCYVSKCSDGEVLSPDYECVLEEQNDNSTCPSLQLTRMYQDDKEKKMYIETINFKYKRITRIGVLIMCSVLISALIIYRGFIYKGKYRTIYDCHKQCKTDGQQIVSPANNEQNKYEKLLVAAIDFGTTYSGYAFCTREEYRKNKKMPDIKVRKWDNKSYKTNKLPTCVLFNPAKKFDSFGYDAMYKIRDNPNEIDYSKWYYFEHFKICLFTEKDKLNKKMMLEESLNVENPEKKKKLKAIDVFASVISCFKEDLPKEFKRQIGTDIKNEEIHWLITVPAIWNLQAKQFMIDAAEQAGISRNSLTLAVEPLAASMYYQLVQNCVHQDEDDCQLIAAMEVGSKYVVLDQGGGTTDLAVYEVTVKNTLKEIHQACGGIWGGITVNGEFKKLLIKLLGGNVVDIIKMQEPSDYYDFLGGFEDAKTSFLSKLSKLEDENQTWTVPLTWLQCYKDETGGSLEECLSKSEYKNNFSIKDGRIRMKNKLFDSFFNYSIEHVVTEMEIMLNKKDLNEVKTILIVGDYSKSSIFTNAIYEKFEGKYGIVIPKDTDIAVMKGAVLFGFNPK